jgi:hypothetical protein
MRPFQLLAAILIVVGLAEPTSARQASSDRPRGDVFAGFGVIPGRGYSQKGAVLAAALRTGKHIAIVADMGAGLWPLGVGVRFQGDRTVSPYAQFLADIYLGLQVGMGVDVRVRQRIFIRAAFDAICSEDGSRGRFSAGVAYQFRGRQSGK